MLLAIDIGNTNIVVGVFEGEHLQATWRIATHLSQTTDEYGALLLSLLQHRSTEISDIKEVAICCVVPPLITTFEKLCQQYFHVLPLVVGPGIKTGVRIHADNPREVGTDRIVDTAAAHHLYGHSAIVVDMGTATTFDVVSKEGDYLGGAIAPGIAIAAEALYTRAAALPRVELTSPRRAIGTNTITAMQSGIIFGYAGLVEALVARISREIGATPRVIATGGLAELIVRETGAVPLVDQHLTLEGLRLLWERARPAVSTPGVRG